MTVKQGGGKLHLAQVGWICTPPGGAQKVSGPNAALAISAMPGWVWLH